MTESERLSLLKLWEDVPECRPKPSLSYRKGDSDLSGWYDEAEWSGSELFENHAAAIARDAMVEYLHEQCWQHNSAKQPNHHDPKQRYILWHGGSAGHTGETRLLALVSACRKVAGK